MKRSWTEEELIERWTLTPDELPLLANKSGVTRLGFAALLRFFAGEGQFPRSRNEVPGQVVTYIGNQVGVPAEEYLQYDWQGRTIKYHRAQIREFFGFREITEEDGEQIASWLVEEVVPGEPEQERLVEVYYKRCRETRIEPPSSGRVERLVASARRRFEKGFCGSIFRRLADDTLLMMDALLATSEAGEAVPVDDPASRGSWDRRRSVLGWLKADPGRASLDGVLEEIDKLRRVRELGIPPGLFAGVSSKIVETYRRRAATEGPSEIRAHPPEIRATLLSALLWSREREITDSLVDLFIQLVHRTNARAEKRVEKDLLKDLKKVIGKTSLLFRMAETAVENPDQTIREALYPVVGEQTLKELVREFKNTGPAFKLNVHARLRASYRGHYRQMLSPLLEALDFRSNNADHQPAIEALRLLRKYDGSAVRSYAPEEDVPIRGVVPDAWADLLSRKDAGGDERVKRVGYEVCVLRALREGLRRREVWVVGADRYRNPDEDLPQDFEEKCEEYYEELGQPLQAERFVEGLQREMEASLATLDKNVLTNPSVRISEYGGGRVLLSPLKPLPEPPNLKGLKAQVGLHWPMTGLLDIFKEADLRVAFTNLFSTSASREILDPDTLRKRLLLCLYGLGTNTGLKRLSASDPDSGHEDLRYVRRKYITRKHLRAAIARVVNEIFKARRREIWGEGTTACASDSKKFGAWDQNLMTEWHIRYGGRGVIIYWHVARKSVCIYSQLKSCSSSEVAAMIEGVLRHCTDMSVEKNYVDSHGQSEVGFAFAHLLGFELLPRLKPISRQKLYRPGRGQPDA